LGFLVPGISTLFTARSHDPIWGRVLLETSAYEAFLGPKSLMSSIFLKKHPALGG